MPAVVARPSRKEGRMRRMLIPSLAAAAACGGPSRSDLIIDWTFEGKPCADVGVADIQFAIANEVLSPDHFTCEQAAAGVDLGSFLVGDYQLTITGSDAVGTPTHQVVQTLQVRGRSGGRDEIAVDVPRVKDSTTADLTWTFSPGPDCATANVQQVTIYVDPNPDRKSTRLNSSHSSISYAVFCLKKKKKIKNQSYILKEHKPMFRNC